MKNNESSKSIVTRREKDVLRCLRNGSTSREIAQVIGVSERTVKFHIGNIISKLKVKNRTQAVVLAIKKGLVD